MTVVNFNYPKFKYTIPSTGEPGAGYKLFTYEEGTSTKKTTWTSLAKTAENTNPIVLDANGEADVWIDGNYKFVLALPTDTDPPASPVWTYDAIRSSETTASTTSTATTPLNGSFETDSDADGAPDNWTIAALSGGTIAIDATSSAHGVNSLKFTSTGSGGGSISTTEYYEVEAGKDVGIRFDIISANADTHNIIEIYWYTGAKVYLSATSVYDDAATNPTSWTRKYLSATAPATAKFAKIVITGVAADSTSHTTTNIDNVELDTTYTGELFGTSSPSKTELTYLTGVTSAIQTQINTLNTNKGGIHNNVSNVDGGPYISSTTFDVTALTKATWESVGPTGGGATHTWTALDSIPSDVSWIKIRSTLFTSNIADVASTAVGYLLYSRANGSAVSPTTSTLIDRVSYYTDTSHATADSNINEITVPVNSAIFDLYWNTSPFAVDSVTHTLSLVGYGYN